MRYNYIAIEGNIGSGKSTLAKKLAGDCDAHLILEEFEENSFLRRFYEQPERYAFPLELSFLADRYEQLNHYFKHPDLFKQRIIADYVIDKSIIFSRVTLNDHEYKLFLKLFEIIYANIVSPDLIIFLHASTPRLLENIKKRGRPYEQNIQQSYLERLQEGYWNFLKLQENKQRILMIDVEQLDFLSNEAHYAQLLNALRQEYKPGISVLMNR